MSRVRWFLLLTVVSIAAIPILFSRMKIGGGWTSESPDGQYRLSTWSTLSSDPGGSYSVELFKGASSEPIRTISVRVGPTESTPVMRGRSDARWDMAAGTVDLIVNGRAELRLYFQPDTRPTETPKG